MLLFCCMLNGNGEAFSSSITCSRILVEMSVILELRCHLTKERLQVCFFVLCHKPAHSFTGHTVLPITLRSYVLSFPWQCGKQPYMILRGKASAS